MTEFRLPAEPAPGKAAILTAAGKGTLRKTFWALAIACLIFFASSRSYVPSPGITNLDDKIGHFALYGLLGTLVCRVGRGWRSAAWALLLVSAFGASDEWHQSFVPGRWSDVRDWLADSLGAGVAVTLYTGWTCYRELLEHPLFRRRNGVENFPAIAKVRGQ
jgi:VanZ family protein